MRPCIATIMVQDITRIDPDETTPSDVSERPSVDDVESDTGSTGALETRSLKDHKGKT